MSMLPSPLPGLGEPLWLPAPESPRLPINELHIWRTRLVDPSEMGGGRWQVCPVSRDRTEKVQAALFRRDILRSYTGGETDESGKSSILSGPASRLRVVVSRC